MGKPGRSTVSAVCSSIQSEAAINASTGEEHRMRVERCLKTLVHTSNCRIPNCLRASCSKMRRVLNHLKACGNKSRLPRNDGKNQQCSICRQTIVLCSYHAKKCQDQRCPVPLCVGIRAKFREMADDAELKRQAQLVTNHLPAVELEGNDPSVEIKP